MKDKKDAYLTFRTTSKIKEELEKEANEIDRPLSWLLNKIVTEYTEKKDKPKNEINFKIVHNENINL